MYQAVSKRIKLKVGDMLVSHYTNPPEQGILIEKHESYFDEQRGRQMKATWEVFGWPRKRRVLDSWIRKAIRNGDIEHYPVKK